jgi:cob(I)alamin adenosyltransferase
MLDSIQNELFDLGADLATPGEDFTPGEMNLRIVQAQIDRLEREIDAMNDRIPPLKSFILPGGSEAAAWLHLARTVARRAEREITALAETQPVGAEAIKYINRLSDHLFVMARRLNANGADDILWVPGKNR